MYDFSANEYVVYANSGVCLIESIDHHSFDGGNINEDYYILKPINSNNSTLFIPCNNEKLTANMRYPLSKAEIDDMLANIEERGTEWVEDKKQRPLYFREIIRGGNRRELLSMICCIYLKKQELIGIGKKLPASDERILDEAKRIINEEFAFTLGIDSSEVNGYIKDKIENEK